MAASPPSPSNPPAPDGGIEPVAAADLADLAAGEMDGARADAIRARAAKDPTLAARLEAAERFEAALRAQGREEECAPLPLGLVARVLEAVRGGGAPSAETAPARRAGRLKWAAAAAVALLSVGLSEALPSAASAFGGTEASPVAQALGVSIPRDPASVEGVVRAGLVDVADGWKAVAGAPAGAPGGPGALLAASAVCLAAGLLLARRAASRAISPVRVPRTSVPQEHS